MPEALTESPPTALSAWKDIALLLLGATADHAVHCGETEVEAFRKLLRDSIESMQESNSNSQVLMSAGAISQAISHYFSQTQRQVDSLQTDAGAMSQMFLEFLENRLPATDLKRQLVPLRETVEASIRNGNLGPANQALAEFLDEWGQQAEESRRLSLELTSGLAVLKRTASSGPPVLRSSTARSPSQSQVDSCTGLPKRSEAESAITRSIESGGQQSYAAVFYLHRMALTNARFGESIGNQVILFSSQHIATLVTRNNDALFRWSGPAFVAILERTEPHATVAAEVQRLIAAPLSRFFETSNRSVYLPVKVTAHVVPLFDTNFAEVSAQVEKFILDTSGQGNVA